MKNIRISFIQACFTSRENKENAQAMAAYMKTTMPFYGIRVPERRRIVKEALKSYPIKSQAEYIAAIQSFWDQSRREEKYVAIDIARSYPHYITMESLSIFERMIREGAWWDFVDDIAVHLIGPLLMNYSSEMWPILEKWSQDAHLWIRRTVIISQNRFKTKTDHRHLFNVCLQHADNNDFFIRKAIGWALREYAKTNPELVCTFIETNKAHLSNLSYKEASKHLLK